MRMRACRRRVGHVGKMASLKTVIPCVLNYAPHCPVGSVMQVRMHPEKTPPPTHRRAHRPPLIILNKSPADRRPWARIRGLLTHGILASLLFSIIIEERMRGIRKGSGIVESDPCRIREGSTSTCVGSAWDPRRFRH